MRAGVFRIQVTLSELPKRLVLDIVHGVVVLALLRIRGWHAPHQHPRACPVDWCCVNHVYPHAADSPNAHNGRGMAAILQTRNGVDKRPVRCVPFLFFEATNRTDQDLVAALNLDPRWAKVPKACGALSAEDISGARNYKMVMPLPLNRVYCLSCDHWV